HTMLSASVFPLTRRPPSATLFPYTTLFRSHGVLFLDELPEFDRRALEALREPLETGCVTVARAAGSCTFPARFQLVAAMNPCPCGWHGHPHPRRECRCSRDAVARHKARISGPLLDRIDLHVSLGVESNWLDAPPGEASS